MVTKNYSKAIETLPVLFETIIRSADDSQQDAICGFEFSRNGMCCFEEIIIREIEESPHFNFSLL